MFAFGTNNELAEVKPSKTAPPRIVPIGELVNYPFAVYNKARIAGIVIDVDDVETDESGFMPGFDEGTYEWAGAPMPACVVSTTGPRFQAFYLLADPLPLRRNASPKSFAYFNDIRDSLTLSLNGDFAVPYRGTVRNPSFVDAKIRVFHDKGSKLGDLQTYAKLDAKTFERWSSEYKQGNRNRATFLYLLDEFKASGDTLTKEALIAKAQTFQNLKSGVQPLGLGEITGIAASVLRNGGHYNRPGRRHEPHWNVGALGLEPVNWASMTPEERRAEIKRRQLLGQTHRGEVVKAATLAKLQTTLADMLKAGTPVTVKGLARAAKVTRNTVKAHWQSLTGEVR
jgi:hypothetical protein